MNPFSRTLVFIECLVILAPLSLLAAIGFRITWSTVSHGLILATINPVAIVVVSVVAVIALLCAWVISIRYITTGPQGLVKLSGWLYAGVAMGGVAGGYGALRFSGFDSLYGLGITVFVPLAHLLVARHQYLCSKSARGV